MYKAWNGFSKALRTYVTKLEDEFILNTLHFGKFHIGKLEND